MPLRDDVENTSGVMLPIAAALTAQKKIDVFVLPDNGLLKFGGFHLNLEAGLEDSLINDRRPIWNKRFGKTDAKAKAKAA